MEGSGELDYSKDESKNTGNVMGEPFLAHFTKSFTQCHCRTSGGKKAAIHNDRVPDETKERLRQELEQDGVDTTQL